MNSRHYLFWLFIKCTVITACKTVFILYVNGLCMIVLVWLSSYYSMNIFYCQLLNVRGDKKPKTKKQKQLVAWDSSLVIPFSVNQQVTPILPSSGPRQQLPQLTEIVNSSKFKFRILQSFCFCISCLEYSNHLNIKMISWVVVRFPACS